MTWQIKVPFIKYLSVFLTKAFSQRFAANQDQNLHRSFFNCFSFCVCLPSYVASLQLETFCSVLLHIRVLTAISSNAFYLKNLYSTLLTIHVLLNEIVP